ncbi:zinc-binding alcohol dehydrogenase [Rothia sp. AR01]|uniref:Zinc-binding alcohol dehydrogenase n=1 Tax=Rothia santali TaxID=2949643 RepID=A0A9X2HFY6_9MICC|nr:zinc-binding alcohol dehydrogenase [Rothia santali]MCP3425011.1 zinc-binding alcohol dehydrogenase [Rothia santali]
MDPTRRQDPTSSPAPAGRAAPADAPGPAASPGGCTAYWVTAPGEGELRRAELPPLGPGDALVRTLYTGISRGTELLVRAGRVPDAVAERMRAPHQEGSFGFPVKYGYLSVGIVEDGPGELVGRRVFCLYPHQDRYVVPAADLVPLPDDVPSRRAILAGTVETVLNAVWDGPPCAGDRIAVVGAGLIGAALARLLGRFPLDRLQVVDPDPVQRLRAERLGIEAVDVGDAAGECDLVFHASATQAGLDLGLSLLGDEGQLVELSWFGTRAPEVPLGADFHARRLSIVATQVSQIGRARRNRRDHRERFDYALRLLADPAFDELITGETEFAEIEGALAALEAGRLPSGCHAIAYP